MHRLLLIFALTLVVSSCKSLLYSKTELTGIPGKSNIITVRSPKPPDSLFSDISKGLVKRNWIINSSKESGQISAESKLMYYKMFIRPIIHVSQDGAGSKATFQGSWSRRPQRENTIDYIIFIDDNTIRRIQWGGYRTDDGAAYQDLMMLAQKTTGITEFEHSKSAK